MRILFLARLFYPHIGGVEKHVWEVSLRLKKRGHKVIVLTELHDSKLKRYEKQQGIEIFRIPIGKSQRFKKILIWKWLWQHRELIEHADVIHAHDVFYWTLPFKIIFFKKIYTTFHGYESYPLKKKNIWIRRMSAFLSEKTISVGKCLDVWYGTHSDKIIYGASDPIEIKQKINPRSAMFIGRLDDQTGIDMYYKAFKLIRKKIPLFRFTVIGEGVYRKDMDASVRVVGSKKNPYVFFSTHRFAFISRYLAILEAFSARRLVFAVYDNPIKRDYLTITPFSKYMVVVKSEAELAEKVFYYLNHPVQERVLIEKAAKWVNSQTWDTIANLYLKLWAS